MLVGAQDLGTMLDGSADEDLVYLQLNQAC